MRLSLTSSTFGDEEKAAIASVVDSDMFTMGRHVSEFEAEFAALFGRRYACMVNSGSSANLVAVAALFYRKERPLRPGDEVIVPCISWATTFYPLHQYGLKLRFVDIDINTLNIDAEQLELAITPRTRMIVAVSILGNPCRFDKILEICQKHNLILFEDNCESMGAVYDNRYTGTFGLVGTFSTFFSHHISTMEGGLILTDDFEIDCLCRSIRNHGWCRGQPEGSPIFEKKESDFYEAYRFILPGYNVRPMEMQGAIGKVQLKKLDAFLSARRANAAHFVDIFKDDKRFIIQQETGQSSWFCFTMIVNPDSHTDRGAVLNALKNAEIEYRIITGGNMLRHDVIKYFDYEVLSSTQADTAHDCGFFVGNHPVDIRSEIDYLHNSLKGI
ncbi:DegT/DnrJ/EryC1/StrS family aminotransferase [Candidatus Magnetominusculus xianensis]|uniref:Pyridoxamine 5-phosphate oxidase n=1 Tax=Candidatus Magnetominusculus xianensis TaxID=1748249 RepID=A0ABR5SJA4_9BACT|nr:DegT/DnrJ/EryC1/StrS family aminotransferase [Candidatus Magnetominusculus xianensis]KWT85895.1 pyridoxamine 5-phosphate oxidase [Candidatus Magnetominusculus xianensis]MBF0403568.1 DegT/DnrJ/EryC1/StrS family aminotransferase [Nitrospirota bacterium]